MSLLDQIQSTQRRPVRVALDALEAGEAACASMSESEREFLRRAILQGGAVWEPNQPYPGSAMEARLLIVAMSFKLLGQRALAEHFRELDKAARQGRAAFDRRRQELQPEVMAALDAWHKPLQGEQLDQALLDVFGVPLPAKSARELALE